MDMTVAVGALIRNSCVSHPEWAASCAEGGMRTVLAVHEAAFALEVFVVLYFVAVVVRADRLHVHFKAVLLCAAVSGFLIHVTRLAAHLLLEMSEDARGRLAVRHLCLLLSYTHLLVIISVVSSSLMLGVERCMASYWIQTYEQMSAPGTFIGLLLTVCLAAACAINYFSFAQYVDDHTDLGSYIVTDTNAVIACMGFCLGMLGSVTGVLLQIIMNRRNKVALLRSNGIVSLTARYQSEEIKVSSEILVMVMFCYVVACGVGMALSVWREYVVLRSGAHSCTNKVLAEVSYLILDSTILVALSLFMLKHEYLRSILHRDLRRLVSAAFADRVLGPQAVFVRPSTSEYFRNMNAVWEVSVRVIPLKAKLISC